MNEDQHENIQLAPQSARFCNLALFSSRCASPLAVDVWTRFLPCDPARLGAIVCGRRYEIMIAHPGEQALRTTLRPLHFWHLALCSSEVAEELLELFALVLERNRFRPRATSSKRAETSPQQLPAPSAETAPAPAAAPFRNLSNTLLWSTSNLNDFHVPSILSRH